MEEGIKGTRDRGIEVGTGGRAPVRRRARLVTNVNGRPEDRERAVARLAEAEAAGRVHGNRRTLDRQSLPSAIFLKWLNKWSFSAYNAVVGGRRLDDVALEYTLAAMSRSYAAVTSFVLTHALGIVGPKAHRARVALCGGCVHLIADYRGAERCQAGQKGRGCKGVQDCDCPVHWWWYPGRNRYKIWWRNYRCSIGLFGRWAPEGLVNPAKHSKDVDQ